MKKKTFFDSRDKYLSFVNSTNEKSKIAFYLSEKIGKISIQSSVFKVFDAGTGEGTIISTFLSALHKSLPSKPIFVVGKEISIDDINVLLSFLGDRFAEHKTLIFNITNCNYKDLTNLTPNNVKFEKLELVGNKGIDFTKTLMNLSPYVRKNWKLSFDRSKGIIKPKSKIFLSIYRKDQKRFLNHLIPKNISEVPKKYDFIIASQCFKLRSPLVKIVKNIIQPLLSLLNLKGQMFLIYSSGKDFTKSFLKYYYPNIRFYNNSEPKKLISQIKKYIEKDKFKIKLRRLKYTFNNLSINLKEFSFNNIFSVWNAVNYVGQVSEIEEKKILLNKKNIFILQKRLSKLKKIYFEDNIVNFRKERL